MSSSSTPQSALNAPLPLDAQIPPTPRSGCVELFEEIEYDWLCESENEEEWSENEEERDWEEEDRRMRGQLEGLPITPDLSRSASSVFQEAIYLNGDDSSPSKGLGLYILPSKTGYFELPEEESIPAPSHYTPAPQKQPIHCDFRVIINAGFKFSNQTWEGYSCLSQVDDERDTVSQGYDRYCEVEVGE